MSDRSRLILLNGLPGVGKSTLAREYVAARPGTLNLDIDVLRTLLGGPWEETAELGRGLSLRIITAHLDSGHDVVVPQLVANPDQLRRFENAAAGHGFVLVLLQGESRPGDKAWQASLSADERHDVRRIQVTSDDVSRNVADLERILRSE